MPFTLADLDARIAERADASPDESYTARLLAAGAPRVAKKFGEEAAEATIAGALQDRAGLAAEAGDVLYHLLVLLRAAGVSLDEVMAALESRTGQSGLAEKASRTGGAP